MECSTSCGTTLCQSVSSSTATGVYFKLSDVITGSAVTTFPWWRQQVIKTPNRIDRMSSRCPSWRCLTRSWMFSRRSSQSSSASSSAGRHYQLPILSRRWRFASFLHFVEIERLSFICVRSFAFDFRDVI